MDHNNNLITEIAVTKKDIDFLKDSITDLKKSVEDHKKESKERIEALWNKIVTIAVFGGIMISGFYAFDLWLHPSESQYKESTEKEIGSLKQRVTIIEAFEDFKNKK